MAQDTWQYQGRQYHGWFGDGTAPQSGKLEPDKPSSAATIAERIHDVGHTLIAGLPASKRYHHAAKLSPEDHARLDRLLTATVQALPAGGVAVARHVFGVESDTPGIDGFVRAGRLLRDGQGSADTRAATDAVGRAAQDIGLDHFGSFLRTADDRLQARGGLFTLARYLPNPSTPPTDLPMHIPTLPVPRRLPWGPLIVGLAAQALPMIAELGRREDVRDTITRFGLDPSKPADVTAAYAYLWAEDHGPWLFDTPQTGSKMQEMAERVMRAARADPGLFGRAVAGDDDAQQEFSAAVAPPVPGSGIETRSDEERALVAQRLGEGRTTAEIQTEINARRVKISGVDTEKMRNAPGVVTISKTLERAGPNWLTNIYKIPSGQPVPAQVAQYLQGRRFASFKKFREAFWEAVAQTPELAQQFRPPNRGRMGKGSAPFATKQQSVGEASSLQIHHDPFLSRGGVVYDLSTMRVVTPRNHVGIHKEANR